MSRASLTLELWLNPFSHTAGVRAVALHLCHSACMHNRRQPAAARHTFLQNKVTLSQKSKCLQVRPDESSVENSCIAFFFNERNKLPPSMHNQHIATNVPFKRVLTLRVLPTAVWSDPSRSGRNFGKNQAVLCRLCPNIHMPTGASTGRLGWPRPARTAALADYRPQSPGAKQRVSRGRSKALRRRDSA